jgi:hypothetical protein
MNPTAGRAKWVKPWLTGFWIVIFLTTLTVPAWAEPEAGITQNLGRTVAEPGDVNLLKDVGLDTSVPLGEPLLTIPEFSKGRLQPYLTTESTPFAARVEDSEKLFSPEQSVQVGAGVTWSPLRNIEIFGEYRPELQLRDEAKSATQETDVNTTQHILGGISLRF